MEPSKITVAVLIGVVAFNSSSFSYGCKVGTVIEVIPTIEYDMTSNQIKDKAPKAKYTIDKIISFKVTRVTDIKQKSVKGLSLLVPFRVSNIDNSTENFVLNLSYGKIKDFTFDSNIELKIKLATNIVTADPLNGVCKSKKDAEEGNYFAISGATVVRSWEIYNDTTITAKNIKFFMSIDKKVEKIATDSKKTWWKSDRRVHILLSSTGKIIGMGKVNSNKNLIEFTIPNIKGGERLYPHIVTEIK